MSLLSKQTPLTFQEDIYAKVVDQFVSVRHTENVIFFHMECFSNDS